MGEQDEYYAAAGREQLEATAEPLFIRWADDEYGTTLAVVVSGEVGDPAGESNLATAESILAPFLADGTAEHGTVGRSGRTWLRFIAVRPFDEDGNVTEAWRVAVDDIIEPLADYPLLDEDDYYDRRQTLLLDELHLDYGHAADVVLDALDALDHDPHVDGHDHDTVVLALEAYVEDGHELEPEELLGVAYYVRQRADELDIPLLAAAVTGIGDD